MKLVVVESPSKAKTINKYLGKGYKVVSSKGHFIDLPKSTLGVQVDNKYSPEYVVTKPQVLKDLKSEYKKSDELILAADLDREGEAIAFHVAHSLGAVDLKGRPKKGHTVSRIIFNEITKDAIQNAISKPRELHMDLFNAQQARRVLDRLVGYTLSPLLWKKIMFGLSAGRVQSVALRLIVEREMERKAFNSDEYWSIDVFADKSKSSNPKINYIKKTTDQSSKTDVENNSGIKFLLDKNIDGKNLDLKTEEDVKKIHKDIEQENILIKSITKKAQTRSPKPPFTTSTLQQSAVNVLGFTSKRTMSAAQKLYEKGWITYMRTDSVAMSASALKSIRSYIKKVFGEKYLPKSPNNYSSKSKNAQEAHECIRPVDFSLDLSGNKDVDEDMSRLYKLILQRTLASQMESAKVSLTTVIGSIKEKYLVRTVGSTLIFDGFLILGADKSEYVLLPEFIEGEIYYPKSIQFLQHFTQPPARYSEATIIKQLEKLGIGRPSTYSSIISTIVARKYVDKEGRYLFPTIIGEIVCSLLVKYYSQIVDYEFTAKMEDDLDKVADGKLNWIDMMDSFFKPFAELVKDGEKNIPRDEFTVLGDAPKDIKCPECGAKMIKKLGRYGVFYSCSKYPECKGMRDLEGKSDDDLKKESDTEEFKAKYEQSPKTSDNQDFVLKKGRFGMFWAHPDYPKTKEVKALQLKREVLISMYGEIPTTDEGKDYLLKKGRFGMFWAHPDYPAKKDIIRISKKVS